MSNLKESFFTRDREFYRLLFSIFTMVTLQNVVAYSVNMLDNMMLGSYSQTALSGAATVNQIFFMVQQISLTVCDALVILASQYYGQKRLSPVRKIAGFSLKLSLAWGLLIAGLCLFLPERVLGIFTRDAQIIAQGRAYLQILLFTFPLFMLSASMMAALRVVTAFADRGCRDMLRTSSKARGFISFPRRERPGLSR